MEHVDNGSKNALIDAVRTLLPRRPWHLVSVQLICETANVSRSTFYAHFDDKQDLLDLAFDALRSHLGKDVIDRGLDRYGNFRCLPELVNHMNGHQALSERNSDSPSGLALSAQFRQAIGEVMREELAASTFAVVFVSRRHEFLVGGTFGVLERWCRDGCPESATEILAELDEQVSFILQGWRQE